MVSVMVLVPLATERSAMNWACMSVGIRDRGGRDAERIEPLGRAHADAPFAHHDVGAGLLHFPITASSVRSDAGHLDLSAGHRRGRQEGARLIRSGNIEASAGCRRFVPVTAEPRRATPSIPTPIEARNSASASISGSHAAFSMTVLPSAVAPP